MINTVKQTGLCSPQLYAVATSLFTLEPRFRLPLSSNKKGRGGYHGLSSKKVKELFSFVYSSGKVSTGFKLNHFFSGNFNFFTSLRVTACTCSAFSN